MPLTSLPDGESRVNNIREITVEEAEALWEMEIPVVYKCNDQDFWIPWQPRDTSPQEDTEWAVANNAKVYTWGVATE